MARRFSFFRNVICASLLLFPVLCFAQDVTATLVGNVTDGNGESVADAQIVVTNTDRNLVVRRVVSDKRGEFTATLLPVGTYSVECSHSGFERLQKKSIELHAGDKVNVSLTLKIGSDAQEVTVIADAVHVQLQSSAEENVVEGAEIRELSLNNRNFLGLLNILPGVSNTGESDELPIGNVNPTGSVNQLSFSFNGGRLNSSNHLVDGADNLDRGTNQSLQNTPSVDAIAEFKVIRGVYSAEYGRASSGLINVTTKSGERAFHGDAYEFFRNDILAANDALNNHQGIARPELRYNNFGYTFGGPVFIPGHYNIDRNKTFFFFSQEFRRIINYTTETGNAPTDAMKRGQFAHLICTQYSSSGACQSTSNTITNIHSIAAQYIQDIWSKIPSGTTTAPLYKLVATGRNVFNIRQEFIRVDHTFSPRESIVGRYIQDSIDTQEPWGYQVNALLPGVSNSHTKRPGKNALVRLTSSISPTVINELTGAYTYGFISSSPVGLVAKQNSPDIQVNLPFQNTLASVPGVSFSGISGTKGYGTYSDLSRNYNVFDDVTISLGRHTLKAGASYDYYQKSENNASTNAGNFAFGATTLPAGGATNAEQTWANFLLGHNATFTQGSIDLTPDMRQHQFEAYVQDDFRFRSNLTLNIGLRYSLYFVPKDAKHMLTNFAPSLFKLTDAPTITAAGLIVPGTGNPLNGIIQNNVNSPYGDKVSNQPAGRFAPRFGFAWDPTGKGKTAIRGGYGIAYDSSLVGIFENNIFTNPPYLSSLNVANATFDDPSQGSTTASPPPLRATPLPANIAYTQSYSLDAQQQIGASVLLDIGYYGSVTRHLQGIADINQLPLGAASAAGIIASGAALTTANTPKINSIRPYPGYVAINAVENWFSANYNSLQVAFQKRFSGSSRIRGSYTWSKVLTTAGSDRANAPQNTYDIRSEYSRAPFDRTHILAVSYIYDLPFFKNSHGINHALFSGWEVSGIVTVNSGLAQQVLTTGVDPGAQGILGSSSLARPRPDRISNPNAHAPHTFDQWFNTAAYVKVPAGAGRPGNAGATSFTGPGFQQWDLSAFRNIRIYEGLRLQIRAETFNAFNHTNFASTDTSFTSTTFGTVTNVRDPRRIQLGAKLIF